jgi:hypothetical protein
VNKRDFWLKLALPIVLLSLVPIVGTVYAMVADFGPTATAEGAASGSAAAGSKRKRPSAVKGEGKADLEACCEKLREAGTEGEIEKRATFLSAAEICENATTAKAGFKGIKSALKTDYQNVPAECEE